MCERSLCRLARTRTGAGLVTPSSAYCSVDSSEHSVGIVTIGMIEPANLPLQLPKHSRDVFKTAKLRSLFTTVRRSGFEVGLENCLQNCRS